MGLNAGRGQLTLRLRLAAAASEPMALDARRRGIAIAQLNPHGAIEIADMNAGGSAAASTMGRASPEASRAVGLDQDESVTGGRRSRESEVAEKAEAMGDIQRLDAFLGGANVLGSCKLSLKCVAPGIRRRGHFCEITGRQHFPPSEEAALARLAYFAAGGVF